MTTTGSPLPELTSTMTSLASPPDRGRKNSREHAKGFGNSQPAVEVESGAPVWPTGIPHWTGLIHEGFPLGSRYTFGMKPCDLNDALEALAARRLPDPPAALARNVWREIRVRRAQPVREGIFEGWVSALLRPRWILSAATMTIAVSVTFGMLEDSSAANVHASLNLSVFSASAPALPSTLISQPR